MRNQYGECSGCIWRDDCSRRTLCRDYTPRSDTDIAEELDIDMFEELRRITRDVRLDDEDSSFF